MAPRKPVRRKNAKSLVKTVRKVAKEVIQRSLETKFHNYAAASAGIDSAGNIWDVSVISQGLLDSNRVGDTISPKSMNIRLNIQPPTNGPWYEMRLVLFIYKDVYDGVSGVPTASDLFNSSYVGTNNATNAPRNMDQLMSFHILYDRTFEVTPQRGNISVQFTRKITKKLQYLAGSNAYGTNKIFLLAVSNDTSGFATYKPILSYVTHLEYKDG